MIKDRGKRQQFFMLVGEHFGLGGCSVRVRFDRLGNRSSGGRAKLFDSGIAKVTSNPDNAMGMPKVVQCHND